MNLKSTLTRESMPSLYPFAISIFAGLAFAACAAASASTCVGESCLNQNPMTSGCIADAIARGSAPVLLDGTTDPSDPNSSAGTVTEYYSPSCQASWAGGEIYDDDNLQRLMMISFTDSRAVFAGTFRQYAGRTPGEIVSGMFPDRADWKHYAFGASMVRGINAQGGTSP